MRIIFLAYRPWAIDVFNTIEKHPKVSESTLCTTVADLNKLVISKYNLLITCGWSDELPIKVAQNIEAIGVHCAELDRYSYGSPLQLQIIDGLKRTKHRIFSFTHDPKSSRAHTHNRLFSHEVDLDLSGGMEEVLTQMTATSKVLFNWFLDDFPSIEWNQWPEEDVVRSKRNPSDSVLTKRDIENMTTEQLYNFFRSLEDPYPNGCLEDEFGTLYINKVYFKKK